LESKVLLKAKSKKIGFKETKRDERSKRRFGLFADDVRENKIRSRVFDRDEVHERRTKKERSRIEERREGKVNRWEKRLKIQIDPKTKWESYTQTGFLCEPALDERQQISSRERGRGCEAKEVDETNPRFKRNCSFYVQAALIL
jgi:hypothetical protein